MADMTKLMANAEQAELPESSNWTSALSCFKEGTLNLRGLRVAWDQELFRQFGGEIEDAKMHQVNPLFDNKWAPSQAAGHLRRVWVLKGWPLPVTGRQQKRGADFEQSV